MSMVSTSVSFWPFNLSFAIYLSLFVPTAGTRLLSADRSGIYYKFEDHAAKWRDSGRFSEGEMDNILSYTDAHFPGNGWGEVLSQWLQLVPGDGCDRILPQGTHSVMHS